MKKIFIIGGGCWGSTLAYLYTNKENLEVSLYEPVEEFRKYTIAYKKPKFFKYVKFNNKTKIVEDIFEIADNDIIMFVVPSKYLYDVLMNIRKININLKNKIFISCIKGFDLQTLNRPTELIHNVLNISYENIFVFSGPSHAEEVVQNKPTAITIAGKNKKLLTKLQKVLSTENLRVYTNTDVIGVEVAGAIKNVYAISAGICDGLNLGNNAKSALITRALKEMLILGKIFSAELKTFFGLSGLGDLLTTSYSIYSRNRNFGEYIVKYKDIEKAKKKVVSFVEGYYTTKAVYEISKKYNLDLPIAVEVYKIIYKNKNPQDSLNTLLKRSLKPEFQDYNL
ncbi:MAG: NAD(P)H-dependent glycerol-3-phosphate dehydrogenase [Endomicrobiia bacterium]